MTHEQCTKVRNIMHNVFSHPVRDVEIEEAAREITKICQDAELWEMAMRNLPPMPIYHLEDGKAINIFNQQQL